MKSKWLEGNLKYDGSQLRSLFGYLDHGILGDSIIGWRGPCDIPSEKIVDGEDLRNQSEIRGSDMIHFIIEKFDEKLSTGVAYQRLLVNVVRDTVNTLSPEFSGKLERRGDDLYMGNKKFNISIATASPVSVLIHLAVNVGTEGTPVDTVGLDDFGIDATKFGHAILESWASEMTSMDHATKKVRWVK